MREQDIIRKIMQCKKGSYIKLKKSKDLGMGITKISDMVIRLGIDYYNIAENKNKPKQGLPWGEYVRGLEGYVISHSGKYYLRVYDNGNNVSSKNTYLKNGREISRDEVLKIIPEKKLASEKSTCYTIKFENILQVGS